MTYTIGTNTLLKDRDIGIYPKAGWVTTKKLFSGVKKYICQKTSLYHVKCILLSVLFKYY